VTASFSQAQATVRTEWVDLLNGEPGWKWLDDGFNAYSGCWLSIDLRRAEAQRRPAATPPLSRREEQSAEILPSHSWPGPWSRLLWQWSGTATKVAVLCTAPSRERSDRMAPWRSKPLRARVEQGLTSSMTWSALGDDPPLHSGEWWRGVESIRNSPEKDRRRPSGLGQRTQLLHGFFAKWSRP